MTALRRLAYGNVVLDSESISEFQAVVPLGRVGVHYAASDDLKLNVGVEVKLGVAVNA